MNSEKLRILHLLKTMNIGGIERSVINLSNGLSKEVDFIGIASPLGFYSQENIIDRNVKLFQKIKEVNKPCNFIPNLNYLSKIIKENDVNIIHYHHRIFIPYIYLIKLKFAQIKIIHTAHTIYNDFITDFLIADLYISVSKGVYNNISNYKKNVILISNGIEIENKNNSYIKPANFGYAGRFHKVKGISILLKAFKDLSSRYPDVKLIFRGEGDEYHSIKNFIVKNSLEAKIILCKPEYSLEEIYKDIDVIIQPSVSHEGFGLILIEAMQMGIPVITTNLGKIENIKDHHNALVVKSNDAESLKAAMNEIINNRNLYEELKNNGLKTVKEFYDITNTINSYKNEYLNLLSK